MGLNNAYALQLNNGKVTIPHSDSLSPKREITIEFWMNINSFKNTWMPLISKGIGRQYSIWQHSSGFLYVGTRNSVTNGEETLWNTSILNPIPLKTNTHIAVVINRNTGKIKIYKNSDLWVEGNITVNVDIGILNEPLLIGGTNESSSSYSPFDGTIDEIRLWNVERTSTQIKENYKKRINVYNEKNLISYYECDEGSGSILNDKTNNKNKGDITSGTFVTTTVDLENYIEKIPYVITNGYIWQGNDKNPILSLTLNNKCGNNYKYRILNENFEEIIPMASVTNMPNALNIIIDKNKLLLGNNNIIIEIENELTEKFFFGIYNIIKENRDTLTFTREFANKNDWDLGVNGDIVNSKLNLLRNGDNIFSTKESTSINTVGKRKINNIRIDGDEDIVKDSTFIEDFSEVITVDNGYIQEYDLRMNRFVEIKGISLE